MTEALPLLLLWCGLSFGNFLYAWLSPKGSKEDAYDRSFFQGVALFNVWLLSYLNR